ncbi:MAG: response regulator [Candidatus Nanoarchaeia archaeon]|nr:response regulator [Candidatus Nanoarchaeia archaeon]
MSKIVIPWLSPERDFYKDYLKALDQAGFDTRIFTGLDTALRDFQVITYPLVLVDLEIEINPREPGFEVISRIREASANKSTVIATGMYQRINDDVAGNTQERCLEAGAVDYLDLYTLKPRDLVSKVREHMPK